MSVSIVWTHLNYKNIQLLIIVHIYYEYYQKRFEDLNMSCALTV